MRADSFAILAVVEVNQALEKGRCIQGFDAGIAEVDSTLERKVVLARAQHRLRRCRTLDRTGQLQCFPSDRLAKLFRAALVARVRRQIPRGALEEQTGCAGFLLHQRAQRSRIVGGKLERLGVMHGWMGSKVDGVSDRRPFGIFDAQDEQFTIDRLVGPF